MLKKIFIFTLSFNLIAVCTFAQTLNDIDLTSFSWSEYDLPVLRQVTPTILRGGRPSQYGIQQLKELGIKTIINLENDDDVIWKEKKWAAKQEMRYITVPMSWWYSPSNHDISFLLETMTDESKLPIFIHCKHGEDRTGMVVGLYRVFKEQWTPSQAYEEMLDLGFHPALWALDDYYKETTGYSEKYVNF